MSKIDVHHHVYPPVFTEALKRAGGDPSGWYVPSWTEEADRELSSAIDVGTVILSVTAPGASIEKDPVEGAKLARQFNEYTAALRDNDPKNYGFFASMPDILDVKATLAEIEFAMDTLHADGVILFTRYGNDNHYLGHEDFVPIWAELSKRKAVVFIHPTHPVDTHLVNPHLPQPMFDYPHETGRTAMDLILRDRLNQFPGCKIILSHAGGTLPYLIYRAAVMLPYTPMSVGKSTEELVEEARKFYYDTAISASEVTLSALMKLAKPGHVLFGSDFPNAPSEGIKIFRKSGDEFFGKNAETLKSVDHAGALLLFPRLKQYYE